LRLRGLELRGLTQDSVDRFLERPSGQPITNITRNDYRFKVRRYLDWLHEKGAIDFDTGWLRERRQRLPDQAEAFLETIEPTRKPGTCNHYRFALRLFHNWMDEQGVDINDVNRTEMMRWFADLKNRGQSSGTRVNVIVAVRVYLRDLHDLGVIDADAASLVRNKDLPKLPQYLPRPLPPEADTIIRERLSASSCRFQQGLLLMRYTGLRIGELASLPLDCVVRDELGRAFLKVPLGKLDKERLVPMDDEALGVVEHLQQGGVQGRTWLLETVRGHKTRSVTYQKPLLDACRGIELPAAITPHRLRHTYATTLLNAGMSLVSVMKLLGHRDYRMTLRYVEVTLETVGREYFEALTNLERSYTQPLVDWKGAGTFDPTTAIDGLMRWIEHELSGNRKQKHRQQLLLKRLRRMRGEVLRLQGDNVTKLLG
jgi:site-specific recombinase XerD